MKETWKDIVGYEGVYQISNIGRVKSLDRRIWSNKNKSYSLIKGILLNTQVNKHYMEVGLYKNSKRKAFLVHRLVAITFLPNPNNYPHVNHKDLNKCNNCLDNLEWCTPAQNSKHASENVAFKNHPRGELRPNSKLKEADVIHIRKRELTNVEYSKLYKVSAGTITKTQRHKHRWAHLW